MRLFLIVAGVLLASLGIVWFLQGVNALTDSVMSGDAQWAYWGALAFGGGIIMVVFGFRIKKREEPPAKEESGP